MRVLAFILIAAVWAAFLLPSFFESRRRAPLNATRAFARSTALLASVATVPGTEVMARRKARERRRRALYLLIVGALVALTVAIVQSSVVWLGVTLAFDVAIAIYVGLLVHLKQRRAPAGVVPISRTAGPAAVTPAVGGDAEQHTVRVVAG
jgi:hypothetical protein